MCAHILVLIRPVATAYLQVGVNVNLDESYLARDYGVKVVNTVDVRTHVRVLGGHTTSFAAEYGVFFAWERVAQIPDDPFDSLELSHPAETRDIW